MSEIYNDFTKDCDNHLLPEWKSVVEKGYCNGTYFYYDKTDIEEGVLSFRVPGATRGHVRFDKDMIITEVEFYDTCFNVVKCYSKSILQLSNKWIGKKLDLSTYKG